MAIVVGNKTTNIKNPGGTQITFNHTQDSGDNRVLVIAISMNKVNNTTTVKYNGINMTERLKYKGSVSRWGFWELENPPTGTNQVKINFTAQNWNKVGTQVQSFTGATIGGNVGNNDVASVPHTRNRTVSNGSLIMLMGVCTQNFGSSNWVVDGNNISKNTLSLGHRMGVGVSTIPSSAGSVACTTTSVDNTHDVTNQTLEIKEVPTVVSRRRIITV